STFINTQSSSGLVVSRNAADGAEVTHFKITNITNGTLFAGAAQINDGDFITFAQANAGLLFTPTTGFTGTGSFDVQGALDAAGTGVSAAATATLNVLLLQPTVTVLSANPNPSEKGHQITVIYTVTSGGPAPT